VNKTIHLLTLSILMPLTKHNNIYIILLSALKILSSQEQSKRQPLLYCD